MVQDDEISQNEPEFEHRAVCGEPQGSGAEWDFANVRRPSDETFTGVSALPSKRRQRPRLILPPDDASDTLRP